jgi:hypothetical protein
MNEAADQAGPNRGESMSTPEWGFVRERVRQQWENLNEQLMRTAAAQFIPFLGNNSCRQSDAK